MTITLEKIREKNISLCLSAGLEIVEDKVFYNGRSFPIQHPYQIFLRIYRDSKDPEEKYQAFIKVHHFLWPDILIHSWAERRFRAHCGDYSQIVLTSGASTGKSFCAAQIAIIFWLSDPKNHCCIICSTTLDSLESRVWGIVCKLLESIKLPVPYTNLRSKPPKVILPGQTNRLVGMFAVALKQGESDTAISNLIGRHMKGLMVVLDEATDLSYSILKAIPNLERGTEFFQVIAIGNAKSKNDLHGSLATPAKGWEHIDPLKDYAWETQHKKGICLYFNPYDSPAITDPDPVRREALGKFLMTQEGIDEAIATYGSESDSYYRFCLGFWKSQTLDNTLVSQEFAVSHDMAKSVEWSGKYPLHIVGGLDIAFAVGGTGCVLRLAVLGQQADGLIVLDYRGTDLLFTIELKSDPTKAGEMQIAEQVMAILRKYNCPLKNLCYDGTGVGRAMGSLLQIVSGESEPPHKVVSRRPTLPTMGQKRAIIEPHTTVIPASDLWFQARKFIENRQMRGLDYMTISQLTSRLMTLENDKLVIETKREYIERMAAANPKLKGSPDEADSALLALESAVINFGFTPGQKRAVVNYTDPRQGFFAEKQYAYAKLAEMKKQPKARPRLIANFSEGS